jgi:SagB-type dehydrogenase family enzyme
LKVQKEYLRLKMEESCMYRKIACYFKMSLILLVPFSLVAQDLKIINLPKPKQEGGRPLMDVLRDRQSSREFSSEALSPEILSDLLWAAFGINRPASGKRTAPSAMNTQEIDIYLALADGLYLYDPQNHALKLIVNQDLRALTGKQEFVQSAPLNLVYVADFAKLTRQNDEQKIFYSAVNTGFISENVYLYCSSAGLATVVRGYVDKETLAPAMKLRPEQKIIIAQTVGLPKK